MKAVAFTLIVACTTGPLLVGMLCRVSKPDSREEKIRYAWWWLFSFIVCVGALAGGFYLIGWITLLALLSAGVACCVGTMPVYHWVMLADVGGQAEKMHTPSHTTVADLLGGEAPQMLDPTS